jgi:hypothetical protein
MRGSRGTIRFGAGLGLSGVAELAAASRQHEPQCDQCRKDRTLSRQSRRDAIQQMTNTLSRLHQKYSFPNLRAWRAIVKPAVNLKLAKVQASASNAILTKHKAKHVHKYSKNNDKHASNEFHRLNPRP